MSCVGNRSYGEGAYSAKVRNAVSEDAVAIKVLLTTYFDPRADQLPDMDDLSVWIQQNNIILFEEQGKVVGFIIYDLKMK